MGMDFLTRLIKNEKYLTNFDFAIEILSKFLYP